MTALTQRHNFIANDELVNALVDVAETRAGAAPAGNLYRVGAKGPPGIIYQLNTSPQVTAVPGGDRQECNGLEWPLPVRRQLNSHQQERQWHQKKKKRSRV